MAYGVRQVPQNIMSVEFKLFDFMTLKQFGISVAILIVCFALFSLLPTPWNIVIPIFLILIGGIVIFVPFNGEPFQEFLSSYLEAMISSQRRIWHKKGIVLESAAEKARFYRYGNDPLPDSENRFKFVDQNTTQVGSEHTKLDDAEEKFLTTPENPTEYKPPAHTKQIYHSGTGHTGTNISQSSIHNSTNLSHFSKSTQPENSVSTTQTDPTSNTQATYLQNDSASQTSPQSNRETPRQNHIVTDEDEFAVRNFIFGSVQDWNEKPIRDAAIIVKQNGKNLEIVNSNDLGEFKTAYEYKAGTYELYVNVDSKEFNSIEINHDPVDPIPVSIYPAGDRPQQETEQSTVALEQNTGESEVFQGNYDAKIFDLGQDYLQPQINIQQPVVAQSQLEPTQEQNPTSLQTESSLNQDMNSATSIPITASQRNEFSQSTYSTQAGNMFDQMSGGRMPTVSDFHTNVSTDIQDTPQSSPQPQSQQQLYSYNSLPNANLPFEQNLTAVPNTLNGVLVDPNGYGIPSAELQVSDSNGNIVTSTRTDQNGKFYTYSPIPNGNFTLKIMHNNVNIGLFSVNFDGKVVPPKFISFKY